MQMHNPPHPGEILRGLWLDPMGISITEAAQALGVSRKTLSKIVNVRGALYSSWSSSGCCACHRGCCGHHKSPRVSPHRGTGERVMEWVVVVALAALVGALCLVVREAYAHGHSERSGT